MPLTLEPSNITEADSLLEKARAGDERSISRLLTEQKALICNVVGRFVWDKDNAKDVVQNVFVKILKGMDGFSGTCKFSTWVYRLTMNECIDYNKKRSTQKARVLDCVEPDEILPPDAKDNLAHLEDTHIRQEIAYALKKLPLDTQAAFKLFYYGGYAGKECAEILKTSEPNFFMKLKSARDHLKKHLEKKGWS